nr:transporter [uncultured Sphingomonas sp.]
MPRDPLHQNSCLFLIAAAVLPLGAVPALADENGASLYLLGSGGPGAAVSPPLPGVYLDNIIMVYDASSHASRDLTIGGNVVADVDSTVAANFTTLLWVPSTNVLGGTLTVGGTLPVGAPMIDASAVLTGPRGRQLGVRTHDSALMVGDPIATAMMGWKSGNMHYAVSGMLNVPVGHYRVGRLANIAFHRWAGDVSVAATWLDPKTGWDISGKVGFTFNGHNEDTDYNSGNDFHAELAAEKKLSSKFSLGAQGYYFQQVSDDTGAGAKLGAYRGRVLAAGGTLAYDTVLGRSPATIRLQVLQEFDAKNRVEGTNFMLSLSLPLHMKMPAKE